LPHLRSVQHQRRAWFSVLIQPFVSHFWSSATTVSCRVVGKRLGKHEGRNLLYLADFILFTDLCVWCWFGLSVFQLGDVGGMTQRPQILCSLSVPL
jgi:hypothetical protein